jgi:hypothetical protein
MRVSGGYDCFMESCHTAEKEKTLSSVKKIASLRNQVSRD